MTERHPRPPLHAPATLTADGGSRSSGRLERGRLERGRPALRILFALFYAAAGIVHLRAPDSFLPIMPDWVPWPREVIVVTGWCELAGAAGLLVPALRRLSGILLALYAVCVFPANLHHALAGVVVPGLPSSWWYHAPRLAFQPVLVWGALVCAGVVDWPWRRG